MGLGMHGCGLVTKGTPEGDCMPAGKESCIRLLCGRQVWVAWLCSQMVRTGGLLSQCPSGMAASGAAGAAGAAAGGLEQPEVGGHAGIQHQRHWCIEVPAYRWQEHGRRARIMARQGRLQAPSGCRSWLQQEPCKLPPSHDCPSLTHPRPTLDPSCSGT